MIPVELVRYLGGHVSEVHELLVLHVVLQADSYFGSLHDVPLDLVQDVCPLLSLIRLI